MRDFFQMLSELSLFYPGYQSRSRCVRRRRNWEGDEKGTANPLFISFPVPRPPCAAATALVPRASLFPLTKYSEFHAQSYLELMRHHPKDCTHKKLRKQSLLSTKKAIFFKFWWSSERMARNKSITNKN